MANFSDVINIKLLDMLTQIKIIVSDIISFALKIYDFDMILFKIELYYNSAYTPSIIKFCQWKNEGIDCYTRTLELNDSWGILRHNSRWST